MHLTHEQFERIEPRLPVQRGNLKTDNFTFIRALLYITENGCKWCALPGEFGKWYSIYKKANRWAKSGALERLFIALQEERLIAVRIEILALDNTSLKVHPDAHGALKKRRAGHGKSRRGWNTKLHVVAADDKVAVHLHLSGGGRHDAPEGRKAIQAVGGRHADAPYVMDKAYEDDETCGQACVNGHGAVVPPKSNRKKLGITTGRFTSAGMLWSGFSTASNASAKCTRDTTKPTSCSWRLCNSR